MIIFLTAVPVLLLALAGGAYLYVTRLSRVPAGYVGVVYRRIAKRHPDDKYDVRIHKSAGIQAAILRPNSHYWRASPLYTVQYLPMVRVPPGTIGVVNALVGEPTPHGEMCISVPCDNFQDAVAFLQNGGRSGRQLDFLTVGSYSINPYVFEVMTVDNIGDGKYGLTVADLREIPVPVGHTGVVIALAGAESDDSEGAAGRIVPGHENFQLASNFLANGGQRGVQAQTLSHGGVYQINPWFARVELIPTRDLLLEWTSRKKPLSNYDASLDQIAINIEGHRIRFNMAQVIRIPAQAAPGLVGRFGEREQDVYGASNAADGAPVRRFVERVLGRTVEGYFQTIATNYTALRFFERFDEVQLDLEDRVREALAEWGVEAVRTTLSDFESEDSGLDSLRRQIAAVRDRRVILESERGNALIAKEIRAAQADADAYAATAAQIRLLEEQIRLLSRDYMARERYLTLLAQMKVPEIVGGDAAQLLQYMPLSRALEIIGRVPDVNPPEVPELPESLDRGATRRALGQVDTTVPNASRVLDFLAGGRANLEADRRAAKQLVSLAPVIADLVAAAGAFRQRVVQHLAGEIGVRQFIEIGPDMLYGGSTHEIAQAADPSSRTVSVANDLVFLAHARTTFHLSRQGTRSHIDENILHPETIVAQAREILDFSRPIAILLIDSLGSVSGVADLRSMLDGLMAAMPSGSYLAIAQPASVPNSSAMAARRRWSEITGRPTAFRSREDLTSLVDGLELVEPGVVTAPDWRPDPDDQEFDGAIPLLGVLARKPAPAPILPITIYLDDEANHEQVETAVEELLAHVALEIVKRDDPVIGSWFRNLWAGVRQAGTSPVVRETALMAAHVADARLVLAQDAQTTNMLMQNLPPVLASLQCYQDAVLRVGALLIVKVGVRVDVIQLTAAQQAILDHRPQLACSPGEIVAALQLSSPQADGRDAT